MHVKDVIYAATGKPVNSMINVKVELSNQDSYVSKSNIVKVKSAAHCDASHGDTEGDGIIEFDQVFLLNDLCTMSAELHVRVFESSVFKDQLLGELLLPLQEDLADSSSVKYICGKEKEDEGSYNLYARCGKKVGLIRLGLLLS